MRLAAQRRPALTINKILPTLSTVLGEQIANATDTIFRPKAGSDPATAEALTKLYSYISDQNQLDWVRSDVFQDGMVHSRGYFDVRIGYDDALYGEVRIERLNPKNVIPDPDASEYDPDTWGDVIVTKWVTAQDIELLYSKKDAEYLRHNEETPYGFDSIDVVRNTFGGDETYTTDDDKVAVRRNIRLIDRQYRMMSKSPHFVDLVTGDTRPVPETWDEARISAVLSKMAGQLVIVDRLAPRIRWTVTAGDVVLHDDWSPYKHFTVVPYFPFLFGGASVGLVENLIDSQELLNKVSSQELHVVNTTANSGWTYEQGSLTNMSPEELEQRGAETGLVLEYAKGAQSPQKISPNQMPTGLDRVSYKAEEHIKSISGVSDSMQGFDREDVAAKAIAYKQQRGVATLTKPIRNLERTDYILARNVLDLVQQFYTEPRVVNVTRPGPAQEQEAVQLNSYDEATDEIVNDLTLGEYNISIVSTPHRESLEDSQFEQAKALREIGVPIPDKYLIGNSRLLHRQEIIEELNAQAANPAVQAQQQTQQRQAEAQAALTEAEVQKKMADAQLQQVRAERDAVKTNKEASPVDDKLELDRWKAREQFALEREKLEREDRRQTLDALRQQAAEKQQQQGETTSGRPDESDRRSW
jgi:hypothetical protein